jgi:hypothetical protein
VKERRGGGGEVRLWCLLSVLCRQLMENESAKTITGGKREEIKEIKGDGGEVVEGSWSGE